MTATQTIVERLQDVGCDRVPFTADHAKCICRLTNEAAAEIERLQMALKPNLTAFGDAGFIETVTEDTLTIWQEVERPAYLEVGRNADGRIIGLRIYSRDIADEILNLEAS